MTEAQPAKGPSLPVPLDQRSREIFRQIVEAYLGDGSPLGSRNLSRLLPNALSPATIRNVMSDLEHLGLIYAPHVSAGRLPTEAGLRFFVDSFMEVGDLPPAERAAIEAQVGSAASTDTVLDQAGRLLSGLSRGAGIVLAGKSDSPLKHIEFVLLEPMKALCILVNERGDIENRVIAVPAGTTPAQLSEAGNFLNANLRGRTLAEARARIGALREKTERELDVLSRTLVERGLAFWSGVEQGGAQRLIVRGTANLLDPQAGAEELERVRLLFEDLESQGELIRLLESAEAGEGVRIFIGSENRLFSLSGSSVIVAPFRDSEQKIIGALGVIGPTRLNYARVVPMVDFTAQLVGRVLK
ncbi:MAG: heat-inducible transcriptional repressor HrcA [Rhizobiaceae bacterium]|jgi:heat-inducible transcriptional repressor|nr:heat-inducible transcriptional repressor HrcA [Rhizobiaceae bacterium]